MPMIDDKAVAGDRLVESSRFDAIAPLGSTGQVIKHDGTQWKADTASGASPLTTKGDLYTFTTVDARLPVGANGLVLKADSTQATGLAWGTVAGTGDVVGPASSVQYSLAFYNDVTGKLLGYLVTVPLVDASGNLFLDPTDISSGIYFGSSNSGSLYLQNVAELPLRLGNGAGPIFIEGTANGSYQCIELVDASNGRRILIAKGVASAVNQVTITNAITGSGPLVASTGSDTNIDLLLASKGTGKVKANGSEIALATVAQVLAMRTRTAFIENQAPAVETIRLQNVPSAATITRIGCITSAGTVTFNIEKRAESTPFTAGTNVFSSDQTATTTFQGLTSFASAGISARNWLVIDVSAISSPGTLIVSVEYTLD